jgi:hypothetical protein
LCEVYSKTEQNKKKNTKMKRAKTNEELDKLIKHKNIINYFKAQRLSWFGHVQRMPDTRTVKKIFNLLAPEFYI